MAKLVYMYSEDTAPHWFRPRLPPNYPIEYFDPVVTYPEDTVFYYDMYGPGHEHIVHQLARGQRHKSQRRRRQKQRVGERRAAGVADARVCVQIKAL